MKQKIERILYLMFFVLILMSIVNVFTQLLGVIVANESFVILGNKFFIYTYILAAISGLICVLLSYFKNR